MRSVQQGLRHDGFAVPMTKLCRWFEVARRTTYYKPSRAPAKVKPELAEPIKEMIEAEPSFGYRTVAALLGMSKNTVQRIFQLKGGRSASGRWGSGRGSKSRSPVLNFQISAGPRIFVVYGAARTAGSCLRW